MKKYLANKRFVLISVVAVFIILSTSVVVKAFDVRPIGEAVPEKTSDGLHLYDGNDQDLGVLLSAGIGEIRTYLPTLNRTIKFSITVPVPNQMGVLVGDSGEQIYYDQPNCSGTAFIAQPTVALVILKLTGTPNKYYRTLNDSIASRFYSSRYNGINCANFQPQGPIFSFLAVEQVTLPFTEPIAWPLHIQ